MDRELLRDLIVVAFVLENAVLAAVLLGRWLRR